MWHPTLLSSWTYVARAEAYHLSLGERPCIISRRAASEKEMAFQFWREAHLGIDPTYDKLVAILFANLFRNNVYVWLNLVRDPCEDSQQ